MSKFFVIVNEDDYDTHRKQYTEGEFDTFEDALTYAKEHTTCFYNGRLVSFTATVYEVVRQVDVSQKRLTKGYTLHEIDFNE
jgi:hypothetical protein